MIHMLQCLCGPPRHAIYGILYDDQIISPTEALAGIKALIEFQIEQQIIGRRCEICDKPVAEFWYKDHPTKEQDWDKAKLVAQQIEVEQALSRELIIATRRGAKN
jgi:hypothetical protein